MTSAPCVVLAANVSVRSLSATHSPPRRWYERNRAIQQRDHRRRTGGPWERRAQDLTGTWRSVRLVAASACSAARAVVAASRSLRRCLRKGWWRPEDETTACCWRWALGVGGLAPQHQAPAAACRAKLMPAFLALALHGAARSPGGHTPTNEQALTVKTPLYYTTAYQREGAAWRSPAERTSGACAIWRV